MSIQNYCKDRKKMIANLYYHQLSVLLKVLNDLAIIYTRLNLQGKSQAKVGNIREGD